MSLETEQLTRQAPIERVALLQHPRIAIPDQVTGAVRAALNEFSLVPTRGAIWDIDHLRALLPSVDAVVTLGGDGSILRATRIAAPYDVPILAVNLGRLGFLAEIEPEEVAERLPSIIDGYYWQEERIMLQIEHWRGGERLNVYQAVNESVVGRRSLSRVVRVEAALNGQPLTTYTADGVLVATPTGSTAYSHAAGGPILHPEVHSLILTPICAHPNPSGSLVVPPATVIRLTVHTDHEAALSIDGQEDVVFLDGDVAVMSTSPYTARFLRSQPRDYFYHTLLRKLRL